jgi:hypothetical protein
MSIRIYCCIVELHQVVTGLIVTRDGVIVRGLPDLLPLQSGGRHLSRSEVFHMCDSPIGSC